MSIFGPKNDYFGGDDGYPGFPVTDAGTIPPALAGDGNTKPNTDNADTDGAGVGAGETEPEPVSDEFVRDAVDSVRAFLNAQVSAAESAIDNVVESTVERLRSTSDTVKAEAVATAVDTAVESITTSIADAIEEGASEVKQRGADAIEKVLDLLPLFGGGEGEDEGESDAR